MQIYLNLMNITSFYPAIIVQLLAHFTLGEPWGIVPIIVSVFAAVGVMVISKPPFFEGKGFDADFTERLVSQIVSTLRN